MKPFSADTLSARVVTTNQEGRIVIFGREFGIAHAPNRIRDRVVCTGREHTLDSVSVAANRHSTMASCETVSRLARVVLMVLVIASSACQRAENAQRVLLVGVDGASLRVIEPMIADGKLPHLASIVREGVHGPLRSAKPISSPRIWNTIATGKNPRKHGIEDFSRRDADGNTRLLLSSDRKVHALWNIASDAGMQVGVINWWNTYPLEPIDGVMVADHLMGANIRGRLVIAKADSAPQGQLVHPLSWQPRVATLFERESPVTEVANPFETVGELPPAPESRRSKLSRWFVEDGIVVQIAQAVEDELHPELMMVFLAGIDRISHFLWGNLEPPDLYPEYLRPPPDQRAAGALALREYYRYTDALIGLLAANYGPDDLVMVVSDHGFEAGVGMLYLTGAHGTDKALDGVVFARGRDIPSGQKVRSMSILDVTPTLLAWMGLPVAEDMDGTVAHFVATPRPAKIATYDTERVPHITSVPSGAEEEMLERLRMLGYFEDK
jgi:hypothetical protein